MRCEGFTPEDYGLFSLGVLDENEAAAIAQHLDQKCETCVREIGCSLGLWSAYGEALSPSVQAATPRDWRAILSPPSTASTSHRPSKAISRNWRQWGAIAAALLVVSGLTGWMVSVLDVSSKRQLQTRIATLEQRSDHLARERDEARRRTPEAPPTKPAEPIAPAPKASQGTTQQDNRLRQSLSASQNDLAAARQSLSESEAQVARLQTQLSQQQTELASLRSQQAALQASARAAERSQAQTIRQVQQLQSRLSQLESERARLANLLQVRERQSQQNLRLVADLAQPGTRLVPLSGTESAPGARGYAIITGDNRVTFYQAGLPALRANRTYQIWFIRNRGTPVVSGGIFNPNGARQTEVELPAGDLANNLTGIAVTSEPSGGSPLPTGAKLLIGTVRQS